MAIMSLFPTRLGVDVYPVNLKQWRLELDTGEVLMELHRLTLDDLDAMADRIKAAVAEKRQVAAAMPTIVTEPEPQSYSDEVCGGRE